MQYFTNGPLGQVQKYNLRSHPQRTYTRDRRRSPAKCDPHRMYGIHVYSGRVRVRGRWRVKNSRKFADILCGWEVQQNSFAPHERNESRRATAGKQLYKCGSESGEDLFFKNPREVIIFYDFFLLLLLYFNDMKSFFVFFSISVKNDE